MNSEGSFSCCCPLGFAKNHSDDSCYDVDECAQGFGNLCDVNFGICNNTIGSYECDCPTGFFGNGYYCVKNETLPDCPSMKIMNWFLIFTIIEYLSLWGKRVLLIKLYD